MMEIILSTIKCILLSKPHDNKIIIDYHLRISMGLKDFINQVIKKNTSHKFLIR